MSSERVLMAKVIGEYIVSLRKDKEISQEDLARHSGLNQRSLRRIEAGEVSVTVYSLSKVLDEDITVFWRKVRKNLELMGKKKSRFAQEFKALLFLARKQKCTNDCGIEK